MTNLLAADHAQKIGSGPNEPGRASTPAILAIDPGKFGGWAVRWPNGVVQASPTPLAGKEIDLGELQAAWSRLLVAADTLIPRIGVIAVVEKVHSMPKQGVASTFTFGAGYGMILGLLAGLGIRTELVHPTRWKGAILDGTARDKAAAIAYVRRAFPAVSLIRPGGRVPHDGMADAVCLAEYGWRTYAGGVA